MASLKFIMDVNDDHHQADIRHTNKKDSAPANPSQEFEEEATNAPPFPRHVSSSGLAVDLEQNINQQIPSSPPPSKRRGVSTRGPKLPTTATSSSSSVAISSLSSSSSSLSVSAAVAASTKASTRRRSTASNDSMDQGGYGSAASSSSMGPGMHHHHHSNSNNNNNHNNNPIRPMPHHPVPAEMPMRLTPITGRVSRAKKGVPVHVCDICKPAKTFTRAEHLRRHQLSHQTPGFSCTYPGCDRAFHRPDLLARHQQRHEMEDDKGSSKSGGNEKDPRASAAPSIEGGYPQRTPSLQQGESMGSSSMSGPGLGSVTSPPTSDVTPTSNQPGSSRRFSQMSSSTIGGSPATPHVHSLGGSGSGSYGSYQLATPTVSIIDPTHSSSLGGGYPDMMDYQSPRTTPPTIALVTQGLLPSLHIPEHRTPDLYHAQDASPWTSSASDSTYSTPASDIPRHNRFWMARHRSPTADWPSTQLLSPYPGSAPRNVQGSGSSNLDQSSMFINPFPATSHFGPSSQQQQQQQSYGPVFDVPMDAFGPANTSGQHSILDASSDGAFRSHHQHSNSLSSLATTSAHATEALVAPIPALPSRVDPVAGLSRQKELAMETHQGLVGAQAAMGGGLAALDAMGSGYGGGVDGAGDNGEHGTGILAALDLPLGGGCGMPGMTMAIPLQRPVRAAIPGYLEVYWERVDPNFPVVHRQSFEAAPEDTLRCAMAAVATQFLDTKEDRIRGNQLHEYAWHEAKRVTSWNLQTMQAILLCEYFARFRGRKATTRPSKLFESLYSRVLCHNPAMIDQNVLAADQHLSTEERWHSWVETEARRRLLAGCLHLDSHAAIYQQQRRAHDWDPNGMTPVPPVPLFGRSSAPWKASSADEWTSILNADPAAVIPVFAPLSEQLTPEYVMSLAPYDRAAILGGEMLRLPRREPAATASVSAHASPVPEGDVQIQTPVPQQLDSAQASHSLGVEERISTLFASCPIANTYLALHHTPLRDLLAVGGDSWVFSQKVMPATSFLEHQKRLKMWTEQHSRLPPNPAASGLTGLSAAKATIYASRAIINFIDRGKNAPGVSRGTAVSPWSVDLSDYWAMYVCALICWAFGHRARAGPSDTRNQHQRSSSEGSGRSSPASRMSAAAMAKSDEEAMAWLRMVAAENMQLDNVVRARGRREAAGVVGLVRRRLEVDCVGGRSRLYVDAIGVLRKLDEGANWKWF